MAMFGDFGMMHTMMHDPATEELRSRFFSRESENSRASSRFFSRNSERSSKQDATGLLVIKGSIHKPISDDFTIHPSKVLGSGCNGEVVVAVQRRTGIAYAVKGYATQESASKQCCARECKIHERIHHPNIAQLHQIYQDDDGAHLVLQLYAGGELYHRLMAKRCFSESGAASSTSQMLLAINYLHQRHIVHRDIKLENWVYESDADSSPLRLCDFGFARCWNRGKDCPMQSRCGSLPYMSPDVIGKCYTDKCDMWSLGVVVFALLTGSMPFKKVKDIKSCHFDKISEKWNGLSAQARDFLLHLLVLGEDRRMSAADGLRHQWMTNHEGKSAAKLASAHSGDRPTETKRNAADAVDQTAEDVHKTHGSKVVGGILQTLLSCKRLHEGNEKAPLTDDQYDMLMGAYATLTDADASGLHQQLQEFRNGVGQLRAATRLYDAKMIALKRGSRDVAGSIHTLEKQEYRDKKATVKVLGERLVSKLQKLHRDPLLKAPVSDADYDRLVRDHRMLDTVQEETSEDLAASEPAELPETCNDIYLRLVEVKSYNKAFISGMAMVEKWEYDAKRVQAIAAAERFLGSEGSDSTFRAAIVDALTKLRSQTEEKQDDSCTFSHIQVQDVSPAPLLEAAASCQALSAGLSQLTPMADASTASLPHACESPSMHHRMKGLLSSLSTRSPTLASSCRSLSTSALASHSSYFAEEVELPQISFKELDVGSRRSRTSSSQL